MLTVALLAALASPVVRVCVEGDDPVASFVRARLSAAGVVLVEPESADVRVRLRMLASGVHVVVEDRRGVLVDRTVDDLTGAGADEPQVAAWLMVRDAVERVDLDADAPLPSTRPERLPLPVAIDLLAGVSPDVAFARTSFFPLALLGSARFAVAPSLRVVADAGYSAGISGDAVLHSVPVRIGAEVYGGGGDGALALEWAAGARASTTPSLAVSGGRSGGGVGAAVSAYARVTFPLSALFAAVAEAGIESKLVRQTVLTDAGVHEEPLFAAPLAVGLEVRL